MNDQNDTLEITMKFQGTATAIVNALVHGLPQDALVDIGRALDAEMAKRAESKQPEAVSSER